MHILFLGYSNLTRNRLLPILDQLQEFSAISVAKFEHQNWDDAIHKRGKEIKLYDNYENALEHCNADLVYISTVNSAHYELAMRCFSKNFHVIIDKPATTDLSQTKELINTARNKNLLLAESLVYLYHPQFSIIKEIIKKEHLTPKFLTLMFSFPPLNSENFRYKKELGGGALLDMSSYSVSPGRFFFNELPKKIFCTINSVNGQVETSYSILAQYSNGRSMVGHFGFTTEYINRMNILGEDFSIDVDRVFTIPNDIENKIILKRNNTVKEIYAPRADAFVAFLRAMIENIHHNNFKGVSEQMLMDATAADTIKKSVNY